VLQSAGVAGAGVSPGNPVLREVKMHELVHILFDEHVGIEEYDALEDKKAQFRSCDYAYT
jgi:hypothetical protein